MSNVAADARSYRLTNIDMLRGLVIVIMAIDHVRDYIMVGGVQDPMSNPEISGALYFTRWITHFCAPVFVFLAGTSAGLMAARKTKQELGAFLFKRGIWLVFVEIFIISTAWSFEPFGTAELGGKTMVALQVIWAIGASMIVLAGAQFLGARTTLILGAIIIFGHNLLDPIWPQGSFMLGSDPLWYGLQAQASNTIGPFSVMVAYPLLAWIGIMFLGFGSAFIFEKPADERNALLKKTGLLMVLAFVILRVFDVYGEPNPWQMQDAGVLATFYDFMNISKYPPSLLYSLATLGPMAILCGYADNMRGWWKDALVMFGRVPFAFYVAHLYLIHSMAIVYGVYLGFDASEFMTGYFFFPEGYGSGLLGTYIGWVIAIAILYPFCKWVAGVKARRKDWWLSYL